MVAVVMVVAATAGINYNRERQFRMLQRKLNEQLKCCVIREGVTLEIPTFDILVGDVCVIRAGEHFMGTLTYLRAIGINNSIY